jgi:hypothetical protein
VLIITKKRAVFSIAPKTGVFCSMAKYLSARPQKLEHQLQQHHRSCIVAFDYLNSDKGAKFL